MPTEGATHIDDLVTTKPASGEEGNLTDDYLRELKTVIKTDFPAITGPITASQAELNYLDGSTPGTAVATTALVVDGNLDINLGTGDLTATIVNATTVDTTNVDGILGGNTPAAITGTNLTLATGATITEISTDGTMAGNADTVAPTEKAVKTYSDSKIKTGIEASPAVGGNMEVFVSTAVTYTAADQNIQEAHGLSGTPQEFCVCARNISGGAISGWNDGDVIQIYWSWATWDGPSYYEYGVIPGADSTNVYLSVARLGILATGKTSGSYISLSTSSAWELFVVAKYYS